MLLILIMITPGLILLYEAEVAKIPHFQIGAVGRQ